ncbi:MAG: response regulator [Desulfosarcinaceae bacterium]|nr:response regulator [Desulfosarcinaceae bacterium]
MAREVLFVDTDNYMLKALKRVFRREQQWQVHYAEGATAALDILSAHPIKILFTEIRLKGTDGLELLRQVQAQYPEVVRIIFSGYTSQDVLIESVGVAHQYLSKPCDDNQLLDTLLRAFTIQKLVRHDGLKELVAGLTGLPSLPSLYGEIMAELGREDPAIDKIGEIISQDLGITAKVLQIVNSPFFGLMQEVQNPSRAVGLLGLDMVRAMVLSAGTFSKFESVRAKGFSMEDLWQHGMQTAGYAKCIAQAHGSPLKVEDAAFIAGLMHDIGKLLVAANKPGAYEQVLARLADSDESFFQAETAVYQADHAALGGYLLGLWGIPDEVLQAVAYHHAPGRGRDKGVTALTLVHVANAFSNQGADLAAAAFETMGLDRDYLNEIGVWGDLPGWRHVCLEVMAQG